MSELKPCPFCGESVELDYSELPNRKHWFITCVCCGMMYQSSISQRKYVKVDWNTRPIEDELQKRIAELTECVGSQMADVYTLKARIAELEAAHRWRVVANGELPEEDGEYWVWFDDEFTGIKISGYCDYCDYSKQNGWDDTERVTHWMPLPEPPEVQE